jgi:type II secretory ATPase GspE/PulE/Tfp pilus assembly ATPase PilB-like protein
MKAAPTMSLDLAAEKSLPDQAVARILDHAADLSVTDLIFSPRDGHVAVQGRYLGALRPMVLLPEDLGRRCISHLKAVAGLDVTERRRPQEGRWLYRPQGGPGVDLRISLLPTVQGEDCTVRLLPRESPLLKLENLGLLPETYNNLLGMLARPGGLLLVTGPTGVGKTTTLYACLKHLNNGERKINTIEDPVEYDLPGVRQSQVNLAIGIGFAELLRSVLRQGPDVIMVGEIRDAVTAETTVRAAVCGHLVLATVHSPVAAGALQTLLGLGVHPEHLASALMGVVAQRLVRTLCRECRAALRVDPATHSFADIRRWLQPGEPEQVYAPRGCAACRLVGYAGRTGIFEVMQTSPALRRLIAQRATTQQMEQKAVEEGMVTLRQAALLELARGETSLEEIHRVGLLRSSTAEE